MYCHYNRLMHQEVSFIQRCPLFRVSFIRGSTVYYVTQGNDVKVNEAALTGEAELVRKRENSSPMLFSGTQV